MPTLRELVNAELDKAYRLTAGGMLKQIYNLATSPGSQVQTQLSKLDETARRLSDNGEPFDVDDDTLKAILSAFDNLMAQTAGLIQANDNAIQASAVQIAVNSVLANVAGTLSPAVLARQKAALSQQAVKVYAELLQSVGVKWNTINPEVINRLTGYVDSEAWITRMEGWARNGAALVRGSIIDGVKAGESPIATARNMRHYIQSMPAYAAENLTRTLQLTSFRDAETAQATANSDIIEYKIRMAALDERTCLSCLALHGTILKVDERVDDHYSGRCTAVYSLKGRGMTIQSGSDWFAGLPESRQMQQRAFVNNSAKWKAYQDGVPLSDFVGKHTDDVFGNQFIEQSLKATVGAEAALAYRMKE